MLQYLLLVLTWIERKTRSLDLKPKKKRSRKMNRTDDSFLRLSMIWYSLSNNVLATWISDITERNLKTFASNQALSRILRVILRCLVKQTIWLLIFMMCLSKTTSCWMLTSNITKTSCSLRLTILKTLICPIMSYRR